MRFFRKYTLEFRHIRNIHYVLWKVIIDIDHAENRIIEQALMMSDFLRMVVKQITVMALTMECM